MKKIFFTVVVGVMAITFNSCSDFLDTYSPSKATPELVYENADLARRAVLGIYDCLTEDKTYSSDLSMFKVCGTDIEVRSHQAISDAGVATIDAQREPANYLADENSDYIQRTWVALYECIERANIAIVSIEASSIYKNSNHEHNALFRRLRAEAIVLRAMCYQDLTRNWGNVLFKIQPTQSDLSNVYLPKTDRMEIWEQLIGQLIDCAADLPWYNGDTPELVTQGFARGLAARLALYRAGWDFSTDAQWVAPKADAADYYQIAMEQCDIVMKSGMYDLEPTFRDYFWKACQKMPNKQETLFEIGFATGKSGELTYSIGTRFRVNNPTYGYPTQGTIIAPPSYFYSFAPEDQRRDVTVTWYSYNTVSGITSTTGVSQEILTNSYEWTINKWSLKWASEKFLAISRVTTIKPFSGIDFPIMRYSDVLLMYAEAAYHVAGGATADAREALWKVRHRAIPTMTRAQFDTYVGSKDFQQAIEDERMWEFGGEAMRKYDLIRWGKLPQAIIAMREVNDNIINNWTYNFEFPTRADGKPRALPQRLYYKYDSINEDIASVNIDYALATPPDASYRESTWVWNGLQNSTSSAVNRTKASGFWHYAASGCVDINNVPVANGRPFFPVPGSVIRDYNGKLQQDYGFVF